MGILSFLTMILGNVFMGLFLLFQTKLIVNSFGAMSKGGIRCLKANDSFTKYGCKYKAN